MPIDFPNSPSVNETHTVGSRTWQWTGSLWESVGTTGPQGPTGPTGAASNVTGPTGPTGAIGPTGPIQTVQTISQKTNAYTLAELDKTTIITLDGTFTVTVPGNVFAAGNRVDFINIGAGVITFAGSGLTLTAANSIFTLSTRWALASILFTSATTAVLFGNLA